MAGFLCIAMMKDVPYLVTIGITEYEPDVWAETLILSSHLLCYDAFHEPESVERQLFQQLLKQGIEAKPNRSFMALPDVVIKAFIAVRDEVLNLEREQQREQQNKRADVQAGYDYPKDKLGENKKSKATKDENELLYERAKEYPFTSEKAFRLYQQAAQLGYQQAYIALAHAYFNGWGIKRNINTALKWIERALEKTEQLNKDECSELAELLHNLAIEYENGSDQAIPDVKKACQLNLQAAELGCELAYSSLAYAYLTGEGVEKNLNVALEWAMHEIEANIIYGYNHATSCFIEAGMKPQAETLWKRCFKEQAINAIATCCLRVYKKQVLIDNITIDPEVEMLFSRLADCLSNYQKDLGVSIYDDEIAWLNARDSCIVCHIPISPDTARQTEGKCVNCFISELT
jgi:hypothetical protein